jgi:hypothetical protein
MDSGGQNESALIVLPKPMPYGQAFRQESGNMPIQDSQYFSQRPVGSEVVLEYCGALSGKVSQIGHEAVGRDKANTTQRHNVRTYTQAGNTRHRYIREDTYPQRDRNH